MTEEEFNEECFKFSVYTQLSLAADDWDLRKVYSDWLEDCNRGDEAFVQRWMVANRKHPRMHNNNHWHWYSGYEDTVYGQHVLPKYTFDAVMASTKHGPYLTMREAEWLLYRIVDTLKEHT